MRKEILTRANIRKDIRKHYRGRWGGYAFCAFAVLIMGTQVFLLIKAFGYTATFIWYVTFFFAALCLLVSARSFNRSVIISRLPFEILIDTLTKTEEKIISPVPKWISSRPYKLYFANYGNWSPWSEPMKNYTWSKLYCLTDAGVYNYSEVGDTFYLIRSKGTEIVVVYNTKMFELQDEEVQG